MKFEFKFDDAKTIAGMEALAKEIGSGNRGTVGDGLRQAAARYLAFLRRRFVDASRGDGTWPDLAVSTKWGRLRRAVRGYKGRLAAITGGTGHREDDEHTLRKKISAEERRLGRLLTKTDKTTHGERIAALVAGHSFAILRDTSTLFNSLSEGAPGNVEEPVEGGILVGTAIQYATHHQAPEIPGRPPKREIFVPPDQPTEQAMTASVEQGIDRTIRLLKLADADGDAPFTIPR